MIAKKSFLIMASNVMAAVIGFIALTSMTHFVGQEYGGLMWAMSFVATFNAISDLGFSSAHIKRVSEGKDLDECLSTYATIKLCLTGLMMLGAVLFLIIYTVVLGKAFYSSTIDVILLFVLYWMLCDISSIFINTYNAKKETSKSEIVHLVDPLIRSPMIVIVSVLQMSAFVLALVYVIGALAAVLVGLFFLYRDGFRFKKPNLYGPYIEFAKPLLMITVLGALLVNLDKVILGFFWDELQVGYYTASYRLIELVLTFGMAVNVLIFPTFSEWHSQGREDEIRPLYHEIVRYMSMISIPISVFLVVLSSPTASILFGDGYSEASGPLFFLSLSIYVILLSSIMEQVIMAFNRPEMMVKAFLMRMSINLLLLIVFIPTSFFGIPMLEMKASGAAIAYLVGWSVYLVIISIAMWQISRIRLPRRTGIHIAAGVITGASLYFLSTYIPTIDLPMLIALAVFTELVYFTILTLSQEFTKPDLMLLLSVLNPKSMIDYIKDEVSGK